MIVRVRHGISIEGLTEGLGMQERGEVREFLTARVLMHMRRFMPWRSGVTATSLTYQSGPNTITVGAPYARYLYVGKAMRDPNGMGPFPLTDANGKPTGEFRYRKGARPVPTAQDLVYTRTQNEDAGPYWDKTMMQQSGEQIAREVEAYARSRRRR